MKELVFSILFSVLIGYELSLQFNNPDLMGLGYLILILLCPVIFQQATSYIGNQMVKDRETKMTETLKIMGLKSWIYALAFLVQRGVWITIPAVLVVVFTWVFNMEVFETDTLVALFVLLWLFGMGLLSFTMFF